MIEDDKWLADSFSRTLSANECEVQTVDASEAAIDLIDAETPDLIIMDFFVRGGEVISLLHELKSHSDLAQIPIVMVTSHSDRLDEDTLTSYGVRQVLDKLTMRPDDLIASIRRILT